MRKRNSLSLWKGLLFTFLWTISLGVFAQNITLTGTILDQQNEPVIGATILVKGTSSGTVTDYDGNYILSEIASNAVLEISYVGMKSKTINVNGRTLINVVLDSDTELLDEVVVIGYGTTSTRMAVGSITSLKTDKIEDLPFTNVGDALQGRTAGVVIQSGGGEPGSKPRISIRGGSKPLYV